MSQDNVTRETIAKQISIEFGIAYTTVYKKIDKILEIWSNEMIDSDLSINNIGSFKIKKKMREQGEIQKLRRNILLNQEKLQVLKNQLNQSYEQEFL